MKVHGTGTLDWRELAVLIYSYLERTGEEEHRLTYQAATYLSSLGQKHSVDLWREESNGHVTWRDATPSAAPYCFSTLQNCCYPLISPLPTLTSTLASEQLHIPAGTERDIHCV